MQVVIIINGLWVMLWGLGVRGRMWRDIKRMYEASSSSYHNLAPSLYAHPKPPLEAKSIPKYVYLATVGRSCSPHFRVPYTAFLVKTITVLLVTLAFNLHLLQ